MSEGPKISRSVLVAEIVVGLIFASLMALRASSFPPSVRAANGPLKYAMICLLYFTLAAGLFNVGYIARAKGNRVIGLVLFVFAALMGLQMLMSAFAQY